MRHVYLDHNATTPLDPRVRDAMIPWLGERWGNASSVHAHGRAAHAAVETARDEVAALLGADRLELVFTASGTESNNTVLASLFAGRGGHLVVSALEHPSIGRTAERLERSGVEVTRVPPGPDGVVPADRFVAALRPDTRLACLMLANNELGTLQPVAEVAAACRERGVPVLCDAVQAVGKVPVDVGELGVDYLVAGGHKFHGPLGAAVLWTRAGGTLEPFLTGGSQERRRRASTLNVPAIVGLGEAARLARLELAQRAERMRALRDRFEASLEALSGATVHCREAPRLPQTSHVAFDGVEGEALLIRLDLAGFAVSTGAACSSGTVEPSKALLAIGLSPREALSSLRISLGADTTRDDVDRFSEALAREVTTLRALAHPEAALPAPTEVPA